MLDTECSGFGREREDATKCGRAGLPNWVLVMLSRWSLGCVQTRLHISWPTDQADYCLAAFVFEPIVVFSGA